MENITIFFVKELTTLVSSYGIWAIFLLMTLESALIPIPSEITMPFAGFLAGLGLLNFWLVVFVGAFGNLFGSLLAFWLGATKGEQWVKIAIRKWGKWILLSEEDLERSKKMFNKYGQGISFVSRLLPVVRTFISLAAGIAKMDIVLFSFFTFLGSLIWTFFLAWLGLKLGENWLMVEPYFRKFEYIIIAALSVLVVLYIRAHLKKIRS